MPKHRFFISQSLSGDTIEIAGPTVHHIRTVLRLKPGDTIQLVDPSGTLASVKILSVDPAGIEGLVLGRETPPKKETTIALFQGLPKGAKMDQIVRQATEIGVDLIAPVVTERAIGLPEEKVSKKLERWRRIATEAAQQSKRTDVPQVLPVLSWSEALELLNTFELKVVFWEEEKQRLVAELFDRPEKPASLGVVIGPEGGLASDEIDDLRRTGSQTVTFGERILRTETAGIAALAIVLYELRRLFGDGQSNS